MADLLLVLLVAVGVALLRPAARRPWPAVGAAGARDAADERLAAEEGVDPVVVVDLVAVAVEAGASVPGALDAVGAALGGSTGDALRRAGAALLLGDGWPAAWEHEPRLGAVLHGLDTSWRTGAGAGPALRATAAEMRRTRDRAAREAAGRLGVRLVVPLGLCFLPAFVLVGLVPVLVSLGRGLL